MFRPTCPGPPGGRHPRQLPPHPPCPGPGSRQNPGQTSGCAAGRSRSLQAGRGASASHHSQSWSWERSCQQAIGDGPRPGCQLLHRRYHPQSGFLRLAGTMLWPPSHQHPVCKVKRAGQDCSSVCTVDLTPQHLQELSPNQPPLLAGRPHVAGQASPRRVSSTARTLSHTSSHAGATAWHILHA